MERKVEVASGTRITLDRLSWFKHDTGHVNMGFIDSDG